MNRQKREQLIRDSSNEGAQHDRSPHGPEQERVKGSESMKEPQKRPAPQRQPGQLPLPD